MYFVYPCNNLVIMNALHLVILCFFLVSFVRPSNPNLSGNKQYRDDSDDKNDIDNNPRPKIRRTCILACVSCKTQDNEPSYIDSHGHLHHLTCLHKIFLSTGPSAEGKCPRCQTAIKYYSFLVESLSKTDTPDEISYIPNLLDQNAITKTFMSAIKRADSKFLRNMLKQHVPIDQFSWSKGHSALLFAAVNGNPETLDVLLKSELNFSPIQENDPTLLMHYAINAGNVITGRI